jgi:fido (protein-threonine AMPylation protein)
MRDASPFSHEFASQQLAMFVWDINRMEGTINTAMQEGSTMRLIRGFVSGEQPEPDAVPWDAEGGRDPSVSQSTARQLYECTRATKFLLEEQADAALSVGLIVQTHALMMENAYGFDRRGHRGDRVPTGGVRSKPHESVYAGDHQFAPPRAVPGVMEALVMEYEKRRSAGAHPLALATYLFYEMITIYPFMNGNGRICRLIFAWSLMRDGFPFAVGLSSGHKGRRQHYLRAIKSARRVDGHRGALNVLALVSVDRVVKNYLITECHLRGDPTTSSE